MTNEQIQARIDKMKFTYMGKDEEDSLRKVLSGVLLATGSAIWGGITGSIGDQTDLISGGKILASLLPAIAITDTFVESSEAAMLALTAETGDICVRTDETKTYILKGTDPSVLADWELLLTPTGGVVSVFGRSGAVTAQSGDYSFSLISGTAGPTQGGTGLTTYAKGDVLIATGTNTLGVINAPATDGYVFTYDLASGLPMWKAASGGGGGGAVFYGDTGTSTNHYTTTIPGVTEYSVGQIFLISFKNAATGSPLQLNVNSLGEITIKRNGTIDVNGKDIPAKSNLTLLFDGTYFQLVGLQTTNIAFLNTWQVFTGQNTFTYAAIAQGILATSPTITNANLYIAHGRNNTLVPSTLQITSNPLYVKALIGYGDGNSPAVASGADFSGLYAAISNMSAGNKNLASTLMVRKPPSPISGIIQDLQTAYFDDAPTAGVNNWSINAGSSKFRGTIILAASPGSAGTTPLKLTAGTNVSTPENGAFEYDGTHLYFTIGSTRNTII